MGRGEAVRFTPCSWRTSSTVKPAPRGPRREDRRAAGNAILRGFFGPRIEASGGLRLTLTKDLCWQVEPQDARQGGLYILHVFLTFRSLTVRRVFSEKDEFSQREDVTREKDPGARTRARHCCSMPRLRVGARREAVVRGCTARSATFPPRMLSDRAGPATMLSIVDRRRPAPVMGSSWER